MSREPNPDLRASNQRAFQSTLLTEQYVGDSYLFPPEQVLLDRFRSALGGWRMLDLGVGGGRTTAHFAQTVHDYVGVDYAANMVHACSRRFATSCRPAAFIVGDVRRLPFASCEFDLVLFSFNGIDYISQSDRAMALREIARMCKPGSHFVFSAHNLASIDELFRINLVGPPVRLAKNLVRGVLLRLVNDRRARLKSASHAAINDGYAGFRFRTQYVQPAYQLEQLSAAGFSDIQVLSATSGEALASWDCEEVRTAPWLYYHCRR